MTTNIAPYDALLICSFGGPNAQEDVIPFLKNVTRGKQIPETRLTEVGEHYQHFGGKSPINEQNLALRSALEAELAQRGIKLPVIWGNRNWHPYTAESLRSAQAFGAERVLTFVTSAYASYSGSRQYREHLASAVAELGDTAPKVDVMRPFFNDPGFIHGNFNAILAAGNTLSGGISGAHIIYVTHSIPDSMQDASAATGPGYREQHEDVRHTIDLLLTDSLDEELPSSLAYCSRSGDPRTPWLEPDINDHIETLAQEGATKIVIAPIGFISDHMEVIFDLDVEAFETATKQGIEVARAATVGTCAVFVQGIVDMIVERSARERGHNVVPKVLGAFAPLPDVSPPGSCRIRYNEITNIPVIAGTED